MVKGSISFKKPEQSYTKIEIYIFQTQQRKESCLTEKIGTCMLMVFHSIVKQNHHILYVKGQPLRREVRFYLKVFDFWEHCIFYKYFVEYLILISQLQVFCGPIFLYNDH